MTTSAEAGSSRKQQRRPEKHGRGEQRRPEKCGRGEQGKKQEEKGG